MSKQSFFKMTPEIAMDLMRSMVNPGNQPLGIPFGFVQPNEDESVYLGSVYAQMSYYNGETWKDLFEHIDLSKIELSTLKDWIKTIKKNNDLGLNTRLDFNGIYSKEELHCNWGDLDDLEKCQSRLFHLWINTGIDLHNWACEISEDLAENHCNGMTNDARLYVNDSNNWQDDLLGEILEYNVNIKNLTFYFESGNHSYYSQSSFEKNPDNDFINDFETDFQDNDGFDPVLRTLGIELLRTYDREEILPVIAESVRTLIQSWNDGELTLTLNDDMPETVKSFVMAFESQMIIPGFEDL